MRTMDLWYYEDRRRGSREAVRVTGEREGRAAVREEVAKTTLKDSIAASQRITEVSTESRSL